MSRRKQSNPRQFKRANGLDVDPLGGTFEESELLNEGDTSLEENLSYSLDPENLSPNDEEHSSNKGEEDGSLRVGHQDSDGQDERVQPSPCGPEEWDGPRELEMAGEGTEQRIRSRQALPVGTTWGPFRGKIEMTTGGSDTVPVVLSEGPRWLLDVTWLAAEDGKNNCVVYSKGGHLWCTTTKHVMVGEELAAFAVDFYSQLQAISQTSLGEGMYPARLLDTIQLLPQQAAMASILPTAIVNKDIFPCKACGIWYRSERNLQAHLMYYCSGRQRDPEMVAEKNENGSHQIPRVCPFPQCNMSFSGLHALEMHLPTHYGVKTEETMSSGRNLKCTICDYTADTLTALQNHILSHTSQAGLGCSHCHFSFQTPRELAKHQDLHGHSSIKPSKEGEVEHSPSIAAERPQQGRPALVNRKDVLQNPSQSSNVGPRMELENTESGQSAVKGEANSGNRASFSYTRVKSEPSSPRLASSPVQHNMAPAFPMGPFLSHVPFSQDITAVPQASEILAKMSELVHRRLRHGGNSYPPVMYSTLVPKGATCFECNIAFGNLDNYLVHKKHYCNGRWQHVAKAPDFSGVLDKVTDTGSPKSGSGLVGMLNAGHPSEMKSNPMETTHLNPSVFDPFHAGGKAPDELSVQIKKASAPSGAEEKPNGMQVDSKSPKTSPVENETELSKTTCEACKITFSRQETFMIHKQYYCATRHEPHMKRANTNKGPGTQKIVRTRKRRKASEMTVPDQEHMPPMGPSAFLGMATVGGPYMSQETIDSLRDQFLPRYNIFQGMVPKHPEASLTVTKSALVSKCNAIAQDELDTPMDLSKKCLPQFGKMSHSPKGPMDYHECAVCKISFNKVEDYLAHKQNFCPGTALDNKMLQDIKKEGCNTGINDKSLQICNKNGDLEIPVQTPSMLPTLGTLSDIRASMEDQPVPMKEESRNTFPSPYAGVLKKMRQDEQIWPYYEIKPADYATGILVVQSEPCERRQSPNEGSEGEKEQPIPSSCHHHTEDAQSLLPNHRGKTLPINSSHKPEDRAADPGDKPRNSTPPDGHPSSSASDSESPSEPKESASPSPTSKAEEVSPGLKRGLNGSNPAGNVKYCRPCDIQFNNLSNFITHKKFYCSSHTAEHVK